MSEVHLTFPVSTQRPIPVDHGYALFSAISRVLPEIHREHGLAIHPLRGRYVGDRQVMLTPWSLLMLRLAVEKIAYVLPLAGKTLGLGQRASCRCLGGLFVSQSPSGVEQTIRGPAAMFRVAVILPLSPKGVAMHFFLLVLVRASCKS